MALKPHAVGRLALKVASGPGGPPAKNPEGSARTGRPLPTRADWSRAAAPQPPLGPEEVAPWGAVEPAQAPAGVTNWPEALRTYGCVPWPEGAACPWNYPPMEEATLQPLQIGQVPPQWGCEPKAPSKAARRRGRCRRQRQQLARPVVPAGAAYVQLPTAGSQDVGQSMDEQAKALGESIKSAVEEFLAGEDEGGCSSTDGNAEVLEGQRSGGSAVQDEMAARYSNAGELRCDGHGCDKQRTECLAFQLCEPGGTEVAWLAQARGAVLALAMSPGEAQVFWNEALPSPRQSFWEDLLSRCRTAEPAAQLGAVELLRKLLLLEALAAETRQPGLVPSGLRAQARLLAQLELCELVPQLDHEADSGPPPPRRLRFRDSGECACSGSGSGHGLGPTPSLGFGRGRPALCHCHSSLWLCRAKVKERPAYQSLGLGGSLESCTRSLRYDGASWVYASDGMPRAWIQSTASSPEELLGSRCWAGKDGSRLCELVALGLQSW